MHWSQILGGVLFIAIAAIVLRSAYFLLKNIFKKK